MVFGNPLSNVTAGSNRQDRTSTKPGRPSGVRSSRLRPDSESQSTSGAVNGRPGSAGNERRSSRLRCHSDTSPEEARHCQCILEAQVLLASADEAWMGPGQLDAHVDGEDALLPVMAKTA